MNDLPNILHVARRELLVRLRTRSFRYGTVALVIGIVLMSFAPVIVRWIEGSSTEQIAVWAEPRAATTDAGATLSALLNAPTPADKSSSATTTTQSARRYVVSVVPSIETGRAGVANGTYVALLAIRRGTTGDLEFTLVSDQSSQGQVAQLAQQVATTLAVQDRLVRLGVQPAAQASLFARVPLTVLGSAASNGDAPKSAVEQGANTLVAFGLTVLILMMVVMYGNWVAMSVVEEKSSRVMEVILNAATPFQLLAGKVVGVGSVALLQYAALLGAGIVALLLQGPIASVVFGDASGEIQLPTGLTAGMLATLVVYGILGFLLYSVLYAAAGSLVSRQEDVTAVVQPMTLLACGGYLVAVYTAIGTINLESAWMTVLSLFPFTSPFVMVSRGMQGAVEPWEFVASIAILAGSVIATLWIAGRIYTAGVLMYGQRPSVRQIWRLVQAGA
jgi:ABC-2 type transport system permease protein